jgi:hypothetical protein
MPEQFLVLRSDYMQPRARGVQGHLHLALIGHGTRTRIYPQLRRSPGHELSHGLSSQPRCLVHNAHKPQATLLQCCCRNCLPNSAKPVHEHTNGNALPHLAPSSANGFGRAF